MGDRGNLAGLCRSDANALDRRRTMGCVVENHRPGERDLDWPFGRLGSECRHDRVRADKQLTAEPAANVRGDQAHLVLRDSERLGDIAFAPSDHLVRCPKRQAVSLPSGNRRMRLHHRMAMIRRRVDGVELYFGFGKGCVEITDTIDRRFFVISCF